jgi:hypothetical protein
LDFLFNPSTLPFHPCILHNLHRIIHLLIRNNNLPKQLLHRIRILRLQRMHRTLRLIPPVPKEIKAFHCHVILLTHIRAHHVLNQFRCVYILKISLRKLKAVVVDVFINEFLVC